MSTNTERVRLFLDSELSEHEHGLRRVMRPAEKHPDNPLIVADRPWESPFGPQLYGTVLPDGPDGALRMWYQSRRGRYLTLATSGDGIRWEKPELGLAEFEGSRANNILLAAEHEPKVLRQVNEPSVVVDPNEPDPERRYKLFYYDKYPAGTYPKAGLFVAHSPDGLHWSIHADTDVMHALGDVPDVVWDPVSQRIVCHNKLIHWEGDEVDAGGAATGRQVSCYGVPGASQTENGVVRLYGETLREYADEWRQQEILLDEASTVRKRAIGRAESVDGLTWSPQRPILRADHNDPPDLEYHGMPAWRVGDFWIGMAQAMRTIPPPYNGHGMVTELPVEIELAYSRDDATWHRFAPGEMILPLGPRGAWDAGRIDLATHPVTLGDHEYYYYAAIPQWTFTRWWREKFSNEPGLTAPGRRDPMMEYGIGLARWRREGFVALRAEGEGTLLTKPLTLNAADLLLNVDASDGEVVVELIDPAYPTAPPLAVSEVVRADATRHRLRWSHGDAGSLGDRSVRLRIGLRHADLYSIAW